MNIQVTPFIQKRTSEIVSFIMNENNLETGFKKAIIKWSELLSTLKECEIEPAILCFRQELGKQYPYFLKYTPMYIHSLFDGFHKMPHYNAKLHPNISKKINYVLKTHYHFIPPFLTSVTNMITNLSIQDMTNIVVGQSASYIITTLHPQPINEYNALCYYAQQGDVEKMKELLEVNPRIDINYLEGRSLLLAVFNNQSEMVNYLISQKVELSLNCDEAFRHALSHEYYDIVKKILDYKNNFDLDIIYFVEEPTDNMKNFIDRYFLNKKLSDTLNIKDETFSKTKI